MEQISLQKKNILFVRIFFFVIYSIVGAAASFNNLFLDRQGLNGSQIGIILAIGSIATLFAAPYMVRLFNESKKPMRVLKICLIGTGVSAVIYSFQTAYLWLAFWYTVRMWFCANFFTVSDVIAIKAIKGTPAGYGSIRLFGSAGWAIVVYLTGLLVDRTDVRVSFYVAALFCLLGVWVVDQLKHLGPFSSKNDGLKSLRSYATGIMSLFGDSGLATLTLLIIVTSVANVGVLNFELLYLDRLGASDAMIGFAAMISAVIEIPCMIFTDRLIRRYGSERMILVGTAIYAALRFWVILVPVTSVVIAARALSGIGLSLTTIAYVEVFNERFDAAQAGSALVLLTVMVPTLAGILFGPIFGWTLDNGGADPLYWISFAGYLVSAIFYAIGNRQRIGGTATH